MLRSKTPDRAEQELWALLCVYHAIRELICAAAELTDQDPLHLSFIAALDAVRAGRRPGHFPPDPPGHVPAAWLHILAAVVNPRRLGRSNPREAKRSHPYPPKRADRTLRPPPRGLLTLVLLPLSRQ